MNSAPRWQFGCQARPWLQEMGQDAFREALPSVMQQIAGIGFAGFETALTCLPLDHPDVFAEWREQANGLALAGAHTGGAWWDPDKAASIPGLLLSVAHLPDLGCARLLVSIGREAAALDDQALEKMVIALRTLGEGAAQHGVEVAIHNHAHELRDDARILRALVTGTSAADLKLGADIGWVVHGGWDPVTFLLEFGDRVTYFHIRDVVKRNGTSGFIEVGRGSMDWPSIIRDGGLARFDGWLAAESEFGDLWLGHTDPAQTAAAQLAGMRKFFI